MRAQKQLFRHRPQNGEIGDCHRTAIACLLDLEPQDVPHFGEMDWDFDKQCFRENGDFHRNVREWLRTRGLAPVDAVYACTLEELLVSLGALNPSAYYLLGGQSRNNVNHTVIGCGGEIVWDPSIDESGIVGPCNPEGLFWVTYLVPLSMTREAEKVCPR